MKMRKKRGRKGQKRRKANAPIDEEKLARLEAVKLRREATIAAVKLKLQNKLDERLAITAPNKMSHEPRPNETKSLVEKKMFQIREEMKIVMTSGVESVHAAKVLQKKIKLDLKSSTMTISGKKYKLKKNVHIVGWGIDALMLASTLEKIIAGHVKKGLLVVPRRTIARMSVYPDWFPSVNTRIILTEADSDATPDEACCRAAKNIADYCKKLKKKDILVVAMSSGGDELLCLPTGTIGLREKMKLLEELETAGATSREMSIVRKRLSAIRGGGLARLAHPATIMSLVMSDKGSNELHFGSILDGPTIKQHGKITELSAVDVLEKYGIHAHKLSYSIREVLNKPETTSAPTDPKKLNDDKFFGSIGNYVAASSREAIEEMAVMAFRLGYVPIKLFAGATCGTGIRGPPNARQVSMEYTKILSLLLLAVENKMSRTEVYVAMKNSKIFDMTETKLLEILPSKKKWARGLYLLVSPPPIVKVPDRWTTGKTGTNQELALYFSLDWYLRTEQYPILKNYVVWFLGASSKGRDGNTEYAGAYSYGNLGVDVYRKFKTDSSQRLESDDDSTRSLRNERLAIHEAILPDRVLASGNANLLFLNINDGNELLKLGDASGYTHTDVGDLHIFRIARYQCSCDGLCGA